MKEGPSEELVWLDGGPEKGPSVRRPVFVSKMSTFSVFSEVM